VAFHTGLLLLPCSENTIRLIPPLNISPALVEEGLQKFEAAISAVETQY
jgi:4-aminobutyrate aminotransferase-like enzyme